MVWKQLLDGVSNSSVERNCIERCLIREHLFCNKIRTWEDWFWVLKICEANYWKLQNVLDKCYMLTFLFLACLTLNMSVKFEDSSEALFCKCTKSGAASSCIMEFPSQVRVEWVIGGLWERCLCVPTVISHACKPGLTLPGCKLKSEENSAWVQLRQFCERLIRGKERSWENRDVFPGAFQVMVLRQYPFRGSPGKIG